MRKLLSLTLVLLVALAFPGAAFALECGGEVGVLWSGVLDGSGGLDREVAESLDVELFFPPVGKGELRYEFRVTKPLQGLVSDDEASYFTKKLYLKQRLEDFHLTLGRQPISWSFGSLMNPVDYTLGAVALYKEAGSKYIDALELYAPLNWNSGVDLVLSFPEGFTTATDRMKWGVRGRLGVQGYDLTLNYVQEAEGALIPRQRIGLTAKGDVGNLGVYGALGHYFDKGVESSTSLLLGADYSYNLDYNTKLTIQLEYLGLELSSLAPQQREGLLKMKGSDKRLGLLIGRADYPIDDFSGISLMVLVNLYDGSMLISPSYRNTLAGDIDLTLGASVFRGRENSLLSPGGSMPRAVLTVGLSYAF